MYIHSIVNGLQGVFVFLIYCVSQEDLRRTIFPCRRQAVVGVKQDGVRANNRVISEGSGRSVGNHESDAAAERVQLRELQIRVANLREAESDESERKSEVIADVVVHRPTVSESPERSPSDEDSNNVSRKPFATKLMTFR